MEYRKLISVIIPVYNVEPYLSACLDSVVKQAFSMFEIICINDGSTDHSLKILERYQKEYSCVQVYSKENGGLSSARNYGMLKATGKYVFFLDSDDLLADENSLSFMVENMEKHSLDALHFDGRAFFEDEGDYQNSAYYDKAYQRKRSYGLYQKGINLLKDLVVEGDYYVQSSLQCYSREFLKKSHVFFSEGMLYEDAAFTFKMFLLSARVMHQNRVVLLRRIRHGSIMQVQPKFINLYSAFYAYFDTLQFAMYHRDSRHVDAEVSIILEGLRNRARSLFYQIPDEEKKKMDTLPRYEQLLIQKSLEMNIKCLDNSYIFPFHLFESGSKVLIYGAGNVGKKFYCDAVGGDRIKIVGIVDQRASEMQEGEIPVLPTNYINRFEYDYILIAVENKVIASEIREALQKMGIDKQKIKWDGDVYLKDRYISRSYVYQKFAKELLKRTQKRIFLFMLPEHGNLGDYAIGMAEQQFLKDFFPEYAPIFVTTNEWIEMKDLFKESITEQDPMFITGGGFLGDIWESNNVCREIVKLFPNNIKILFPNTLTYRHMDVNQVRDDLNHLLKDNSTYLFLREKQSWKISCDQGYREKCFCFPDMVLYLGKQCTTKKNKNGKVLLCFRNDVEKVFKGTEQIKKLLLNESVPYDETDTHMKQYVSQEDGKKYVEQLLKKFAQYELVITDRLHGMLLSYLSGTPCIAFDNSTHKVFGVYEWISAESGITFFEQYESESMLKAIHDQMGNTITYVPDIEMRQQFEKMGDLIRGLLAGHNL